MSRLTRAFLVISLLHSSALLALNARSAVSVNGLDTNPCTVASPCRTFQSALGKTVAGGEVVAVDSGGFGSFAITQDVTVEGAPGVYAGVTVTQNDGVSHISGVATLRNLVINGLGMGRNGILTQLTDLDVENCTIENFVSFGINCFNNVRVTDCIFRNMNSAIWMDNPGITMQAMIVNASITDCAGGVVADRGATIIVRNTVITNSGSGFSSVAAGSVMNIDGCMVSGGYSTAAQTFTGATLRISNSTFTGNATGVDATSGTVETFGDNVIRGNTTDIKGTMTPLTMH